MLCINYAPPPPPPPPPPPNYILATASAINAFLMRKHELKEGIVVTDDKGTAVGTSQIAAHNVSVVDSCGCASILCTVGSTRYCHYKNSSPCTDSHYPSTCHGSFGTVSIVRSSIGSHGVLLFLSSTKFLKMRPRLNLPIQVLVCTLCFGGALPLSIAVFPQTSEVRASQLEQL